MKPIDPTTLAFDIDGVVADTMGLFLEIARDDYGISHLAYEDITEYHLGNCLDVDQEVMEQILQDLMDGKYQQPLNPLPGAADLLNRLGRNNGGLLFVTARPYPGPIQTWLEELLAIPSTRIEVVTTGGFEAKLDVLKEHRKKWFVEDRLETCHLLAEAGINPIVFRQPWNRESHDYLEVASWPELAEEIRWPCATDAAWQ